MHIVKHFISVNFGLLAIALASVEPAAAQTSTDPWDWIIQHICANATNKPVGADPYYGCPAGTTNRRLQLGDPMPYERHDQPSSVGGPWGMRQDSYPLTDLHFAGSISANERAPRNYTGVGGYDVYRVESGYVSAEGTRDGTGYGQTSFGVNCLPWNGRIFFPTSFLTNLQPGASGTGHWPLAWDYYEQSGTPWSGVCNSSTKFSGGGLAQWQFAPKQSFGGVNGAPAKTIDAIVVTEGFPLATQIPETGYHLERHYFTDLYGHTRWETWWPNGPAQASDCNGQTTMTYGGITFFRKDCHDWSAVTLYPTPQRMIPWPYPEANVLVNNHFDGLSGWQVDSGVSATVLRSTTPLDTAHGPGVDYLQVNCAGQCWSGQGVHQDVPISTVQAGQKIDYGFSGVVQGNAGANMHVTLSLRDANGAKLWSKSFDAMMPNSNQHVTPNVSIYGASTQFLVTSPPLPNLQGAVSLRLSLMPTALVVYDILNSWMMPREEPSVSTLASSSPLAN